MSRPAVLFVIDLLHSGILYRGVITHHSKEDGLGGLCSNYYSMMIVFCGRFRAIQPPRSMNDERVATYRGYVTEVVSYTIGGTEARTNCYIMADPPLSLVQTR